MKTKRLLKPLKLSRETVQDLEAHRLERAAAAGIASLSDPSCCWYATDFGCCVEW